MNFMNWLQKRAQTGYLDDQLFTSTRYHWEDRQKELDERRDQIRAEVTLKAEKLGHSLKSWSDANTSECKVCGRDIRIRNIHSSGIMRGGGGGAITGLALVSPCHEPRSDVHDSPLAIGR